MHNMHQLATLHGVLVLTAKWLRVTAIFAEVGVEKETVVLGSGGETSFEFLYTE